MVRYFDLLTRHAGSFLFLFLFLSGGKLMALGGTNVPGNTTPGGGTPAEVEAALYRMFDGMSLVVADQSDPINVVLPADTVLEKRNYAYSLLEKVQSGQRFLETLDALTEIDLPIGVVKSGSSFDYTILIDRINFTKEGAMMEVFVSLALPQSGDRLAFSGKIPLSKTGGIAGTARVSLIGDHHIKLSASSEIIIKGTDRTYVDFDCNGFKGISLDALVEFSRNLIIPEKPNGDASTDINERVRVSFTTYAQSLNDLLVGVSIPPFQVAGLKGVGFTITKAFMDWSDLANPPGLTFPSGYVSPFSSDMKLWRGFFLQKLEVRLPKAFTKNRSDNSRVMLGVENMIFDDQGFTGELFAENIIQAGDMSGWAYTLDHISLELVTNQVKGFELKGKISVPHIQSKDEKPIQFGYVAQRGANGDYLFSVSVQNQLKLPLFVADINLQQGSVITVKEKDDKFYPSALLNGELSINAGAKGPKASFKGLQFQGLLISSEAPYFDIRSVSYGKEGSSQSISNYPLAINNIGIRKDGSSRLGIGFDVTINIAGDANDGGFGGTAGLVVWGKRGDAAGAERADWRFDKVDLTAIGIHFSKEGVISIDGEVRFFEDDPVYGEGFKGSVSGKIQTIALRVDALFGRTPSYRYWFADALVEFDNGVPLAPGLSAYGFGGGYYYKMKQSTDANKLGSSASGVSYVPDENTTGIKALVKFGATPSQAPYNGDVMLEVALNRHGGINSVTFSGNVVVMSPALPGGLDKLKQLAASVTDGKGKDKLMQAMAGQVSGSVKILYDNVNSVFHANVEVYINVAGGIVKGVGTNNRAGWAVMHFAKDEWYVLIGTPNDPIGLQLMWLLKVKSYFMMGKNLPPGPPLPHQITEILGISSDDLDYMRDLNAAESSAGFAVGFHMSMDTGDLRFLMFYARFSAGVGADIMVKKYASTYHCAGSNEPIGINGWFGNGQAYAYVQGKIGIRVKLRFYRGDFDILSIGAAAVLQAKGPNPFWMRGIVGGKYRILGGLVKGNCKFEVTIGKSCTIVGESNPLEDVDIIAELSPAQGQSAVDVFNAPQAAFNIPIGEVFEITDIENRRRSFRGKLVEFTLMSDASRIPGNVRWNEDQDVVAFDSHDILPPFKKINVKVRVTFEELVSGVWRPVIFEGKAVEEMKETSFTTGEAPDHIPASNVLVSYPLVGQYNFYPKEYANGFIELRRGQPYLFNPGKEWVQSLRFTDGISRAFAESAFRYDAGTRRIFFDIPSDLPGERVYNLTILNLPLATSTVDANVRVVETVVKDAGETTLTTKAIEGDLSLRDAKTIYTSYFRTSKFKTFREKMNAVKMPITQSIPSPGGDYVRLRTSLQGEEAFDRNELGTSGAYSLVHLKGILNSTDWYKQYVYPLVYRDYPLLGRIHTTRDTALLGLPPERAIYIEQVLELPEVTGTEGATTLPLTARMNYDLMRVMLGDYRSILNQVANYVADRPERITPNIEMILTTPFPFYKYGNYPVRLEYIIPGIKRKTSYYDCEVFNTIRN